MKKSTKIITTAVALALVVAAMVVGIYAATQASAGITANVSWTATAGVLMTFEGSVSGGEKAAGEGVVETFSFSTTASTANDDASGSANLSHNFKDTKDDGVNNPDKITYEYTITNNGTNAITVTMTQYPNVDSATGVLAEAISGDTHTPAVKMTVVGATIAELVAGKSLAGSGVITVTIELSLAAGGENAGINADTAVSNYNAGVNFEMAA